MRRVRLVRADARRGARLALAPGERHHLRRVLRLVPPCDVEVVDGAGSRLRARLTGWDPPEVEIGEPLPAAPEPPRIVVLLAAVKPRAMDWAVEKLSELGAAELVPIRGPHTHAAARPERWGRIAEAAARQCGRARLLALAPERPLGAALLTLEPHAARVRLDPDGPPFAGVELGCGTVVLAIGPEGGFAAPEEALLDAAGFQRARLGVNVLRSETAAVAAVAAVLARRGA